MKERIKLKRFIEMKEEQERQEAEQDKLQKEEASLNQGDPSQIERGNPEEMNLISQSEKLTTDFSVPLKTNQVLEEDLKA